MNDLYLVRMAVGGNQEALALLIQRYRTMLFRIAYNELRNYEDAQDAVAEAIVRACKYRSRLRQPEQFAAWIRTLTRNEARRIAKRNAQDSVRVEQQAIQEQSPRSELRQIVRDAIAQLPTNMAQIMVRFYLNGESVHEIAQALQRPEGTVKWMLSRSRARLADLLKEELAMEKETTSSHQAIVIAPNLPPAEQQEIVARIKEAGWDAVDLATDVAQALTFTGPKPSFLRGHQLVILDEQIGSTNAFELIPLLVAARKQTDFMLWLLLREGRNEKAKKVAAMAAYVSGVDFLLTRPFAPGELTAFAKQIRKTVSAKA